MSDKKYKTEWSFSFDKIGESISDMVGSLREDSDVQVASFSEPVGDATQAEVNVHFSIGEMTIQQLTASDNLFEADATYVGEMKFVAEGDTEKTVTLKQANKNPVLSGVKQAIGSMGNHKDLRWDVRLSPDVPMALNLHSGVGKNVCDMTGLNLTSFNFSGGTGESHLTLPASEQGYDAKVSEGVGATHIYLPENTPMNLKISAGVGEVNVHVPGSVAVRVKVKGGLGDAQIPQHFVNVKKGSDFMSKSGVWETQGFDEAENQVVIDYSGGVGSFKIVTDVTVV